MERWWEGLRGSMCINAQHTALQAHTTVLFSYLPFSPISPQCVFFIFRLFSLFFYSLVFFSLPFPFPLIVPLSLSPLLQFSHLLFLHCTPKMTPLILRSRSRQPPDQPQHPNEELGHWASRARICPFQAGSSVEL